MSIELQEGHWKWEQQKETEPIIIRMIMTGVTRVYASCICIYVCISTWLYVHIWYIIISQLFIKKLGSLECQAWTHHSRYFLEKSKKKGNSRGQDEYPPRWLSLSSEICELDLMKGRVSEGGEIVHSGQHLSTCIFSDSHPWEADSRYPGTTHSGLKWGGVLLVGWFV